MSVSLEAIYSEVTTFEISIRKNLGRKIAAVVPAARQQEIIEKAMDMPDSDTPEGMMQHISLINEILKEVEPHYDLGQFAAFWPRTAENNFVAAELHRMGMGCLATIAEHAVRPDSGRRPADPGELKR